MSDDEIVLPADYVAGFVDGEGCFSLIFRRDVRHERKARPRYFMWKASFAIVVRTDDVAVLNGIRNTLNCGTVSFTGEQARFHVQDLDTLGDVIIPFFEQHPLRAKKRHDFLLWKEAVGILRKHKASGSGRKKGTAKWVPDELRRLGEVYEEMRKFKSQGTPHKHVGVAHDKRWRDAMEHATPKKVGGLDLRGDSAG